MKKEEIIENPNATSKPHVVLLGAGASLAAFPNGDANQQKLPVMNNLLEVVNLKELLENKDINPSGNFEDIYSELIDKELKKEIENRILQYFDSLTLPAIATIYDKLLLSLRRKDAIFTFNWDPFLFDAYQRNRDVVPLPHIYFLHGNVRIGACETCDNWGRKSELCSNCKKKYKDIPLLYPIGEKDYFGENQYTAMSWKNANCWFSDAFTITIFGYSAPTSDQAAIELLKKAWLQKSCREFEHVELIDILCEDQLYEKWKNFTPTRHLSTQKTFENSRLWKWPRRSYEALFYPMSQGIPCETFPILATDDGELSQLQEAIKNISKYEGHIIS